MIFKALADHRRREILDLLKEAPKTTGELCDHFKKIDRCTVMQHLGVLEKAVQEIYNRWISRYATSSAKLLARMKREMESDS